MATKIFLLLLFELFLLSTVRPPDLCAATSGSLHNVSFYNPLVELKLFKNSHKKLNSIDLAEKKKNFYKNEQQKRNDPTQESRAKEYLTISEIPDAAHSAYTSVVHHRTSPVVINPLLAKKVGLSTLVAGTLFYSFTILPLILMLTGTGPFHEYGPLIRRKRSSNEKRFSNYFKYGTEHFELPMLTKFESNKFIQLYENTLELKRIQYPMCKKLYFCKIYNQVIKRNEKPITYYTFESSLVDILGIAVEKKANSQDFISECKFYYEPALVGLSGQDQCENFYICQQLNLDNLNLRANY